MKLSDSIITHDSWFGFGIGEALCLTAEALVKLKAAAVAAPLRRFRYCLHKTPDDLVQQMVIAFCRDSEIPIHRHRNKTESFHIIEGEVDVKFFADDGSELESIHLGELNSGYPFIYRLSAPIWHTVKPCTEFVILHEITAGPFNSKDVEILKRWE